jgi:hypothetical protein
MTKEPRSEMNTHLHLAKLWCKNLLSCAPKFKDEAVDCLRKKILANQKTVLDIDLPPIIYLVLVIPGGRLDRSTNPDPNIIGNSGLCDSMYSPGFEAKNVFHSVHVFFGLVNLEQETHQYQICEDEDGWGGQLDMIVICPSLSHSLLRNRKMTLK